MPLHRTLGRGGGENGILVKNISTGKKNVCFDEAPWLSENKRAG